MTIKVKICGLTTTEAVKATVAAGADYIGFIFFPPSPRNISPEAAGELAKNLPDTVKKVAVVVNADNALLHAIHTELKPDFFQLHGEESIERIEEIKQLFPATKIIKAFKVRCSDDIAESAAYKDAVGMFLFDAKAPKDALPGGNGLSFDWHLLQNRKFAREWLLSGGITVDNVAEAVHTSGAQGVDVSSAVEKSPGEKDITLIKAFIETVKSI